MKLKLEIDIPEDQYKSMAHTFHERKSIDLGELLRGKKALCARIFRPSNILYGSGPYPVVRYLSDGEIELILIK